MITNLIMIQSVGLYTGLSDCIIQLYRQEGMMGFFKVIERCAGFWNIVLSISWFLEYTFGQNYEF